MYYPACLDISVPSPPLPSPHTVYAPLLQDNPDLFAIMEKTRMYIFRGVDPEVSPHIVHIQFSYTKTSYSIHRDSMFPCHLACQYDFPFFHVPFFCSSIQSSVLPYNHLFFHTIICSSIHPFFHTPIHPYIHSSIHSFIYLPTPIRPFLCMHIPILGSRNPFRVQPTSVVLLT